MDESAWECTAGNWGLGARSGLRKAAGGPEKSGAEHGDVKVLWRVDDMLRRATGPLLQASLMMFFWLTRQAFITCRLLSIQRAVIGCQNRLPSLNCCYQSCTSAHRQPSYLLHNGNHTAAHSPGAQQTSRQHPPLRPPFHTSDRRALFHLGQTANR